LKILGISGSGRKRSYNKALLDAVKDFLPENVTLEIFDVSKFPLYNQDLETSMPLEVTEFKKKIRDSDAILFASPEHNYSITAVLKNAIEWGNRPSDDNSWDRKPAAIISASSGLRGGARSQLHLRQIMVDLNMLPLAQPELLVGRALEKFDADLHLRDEQTRELLREVVTSLVDWTRRLHTSDGQVLENT